MIRRFRLLLAGPLSRSCHRKAVVNDVSKRSHYTISGVDKQELTDEKAKILPTLFRQTPLHFIVCFCILLMCLKGV
jgi:hypothetical protein